MANSITIAGINASYGHVRVLEDVSLTVGGGETVVLLGTNGNGKSTLMKSIIGMVRPSAGKIEVEIDGERHDLIGRSTEEIVDLGIALVPEGRRLFPAPHRRGKPPARRFPAQGARPTSRRTSPSASNAFRGLPSGDHSLPAA